ARAVDDEPGAHDRLEPPVRADLVDLHRLDGHDRGRHPIEQRRQRLRAGLRAGHGGQQDQREREHPPHQPDDTPVDSQNADMTRLASRSICLGSSVTGPSTMYFSPAPTRSWMRALMRSTDPTM